MNNDRNRNMEVAKDGIEEKVISIDRVSRVQKGGRRFRFRSTVVVGDGNGKVGLGIGKGADVMSSIAKGTSRAKRTMAQIPLHGKTIPHEIQVSFSGAKVLLKPAAPGTGVIAGGAVRNVVEAAGIHDLLTKSLGSSNKVNTAYATFAALTSLRVEMGDKGRADAKAAKEAGVEADSKKVVKPEVAAEEVKAEKPKTTKKTVAKKTPAKKPAAKKTTKKDDK